ncbi:MAG: hypothetical protein RM347_017255 [Nostoc sp. ChiQUE02]|nr:hypothetical protein [Nostoc sp. ChiQUE02]
MNTQPINQPIRVGVMSFDGLGRQPLRYFTYLANNLNTDCKFT